MFDRTHCDRATALARKALHVLPVTPDGDVLEHCMKTAIVQVSIGHDAGAPRTIDHVVERDCTALLTGALLPTRCDRAYAVVDDVANHSAFKYLHTLGGRVLEQHMIELGAWHLITV